MRARPPRLATLKLQLDTLDRSRNENAELASQVFELSQRLRHKWLTADHAENIESCVVWLNCRLVDATLCPTIRKPFDVLAEGLISKESGGKRTPVELFLAGLGKWGAAIQKLLGPLNIS